MGQVIDKLKIEELQRQIIRLQAGERQADRQLGLGLGAIESAFPDKALPRGVVHELISYSSQAAASTSGFLSMLLGKLMQGGGLCVWVSTQPRRSVFPPALVSFGISPDRIFFVDTIKPKDTLWAIEEALKCNALAAVVGELTELSFHESRRLQLAVEQSGVTGFIHRFRPKLENSVACVSRWKITPLASEAPDGLPGLGFPRWNVQLVKVRNGQPGEWPVQWSPKKGLEYLDRQTAVTTHQRGTGS